MREMMTITLTRYANDRGDTMLVRLDGRPGIFRGWYRCGTVEVMPRGTHA